MVCISLSILGDPRPRSRMFLAVQQLGAPTVPETAPGAPTPYLYSAHPTPKPSSPGAEHYTHPDGANAISTVPPGGTHRPTVPKRATGELNTA